MGDHQSNTMTAEQNNFAMRGVLAGHAGWVTSIVTSQENPDTILSSSRDKTVIVWQLTREDTEYGFPKRALTGHSHFVQDVKISSDGLFALSGSWDGTLRLWDICTGHTTRRFVGHSKDVLSVAFSVDNRQIVSASRDKSIKLWNTLGECKYTIGEQGGAEGHTEWVSCVNFVPNQQNPSIVSGGWDKIVKVWNMSNCKLRTNLVGHSGYINAVTVSPDGSLCASGGKDGVAMLWDLNEGRALPGRSLKTVTRSRRGLVSAQEVRPRSVDLGGEHCALSAPIGIGGVSCSMQRFRGSSAANSRG